VLTGIISRIFRQYLGNVPEKHDMRNAYTAVTLGTAHTLEKY
jgi:hypothetical protein